MSIAWKCRLLGLCLIWNCNILLMLRNNHAFLFCVDKAKRPQNFILLCTGYIQSTLQCKLKTTILTRGIPVVVRKYIIKEYNSSMHNYNVYYSCELTDYILLLCIKIYSNVSLKSPFNKTLQSVDAWCFPVTMTEAINEKKRKSSIH
jgi:hypothetical protein